MWWDSVVGQCGGLRKASLITPLIAGKSVAQKTKDWHGESMAKRTAKPIHLTPRAKQVLNFVINAVALGTHDDDGEVGSVAEGIGTTPRGLQPVLRKLVDFGFVEIRRDFVYPTLAALRWQNPAMTEREAKAILRKLR